jgi:hypothetical protein
MVSLICAPGAALSGKCPPLKSGAAESKSGQVYSGSGQMGLPGGQMGLPGGQVGFGRRSAAFGPRQRDSGGGQRDLRDVSFDLPTGAAALSSGELALTDGDTSLRSRQAIDRAGRRLEARVIPLCGIATRFVRRTGGTARPSGETVGLAHAFSHSSCGTHERSATPSCGFQQSPRRSRPRRAGVGPSWHVRAAVSTGEEERTDGQVAPRGCQHAQAQISVDQRDRQVGSCPVQGDRSIRRDGVRRGARTSEWQAPLAIFRRLLRPRRRRLRGPDTRRHAPADASPTSSRDISDRFAGCGRVRGHAQ